MSKRKYHLSNGLLLPDAEAVPAPEVWIPHEPWRQRSLIDSRRYMGRRRCCCGLPCYKCDSPTTAPDQLLLTGSGVSGTCSNCSILNGNTILDAWGDNITNPRWGLPECAWAKLLSSPIVCSGIDLDYIIFYLDAGFADLMAGDAVPPSNYNHISHQDWVGGVDCNNIYITFPTYSGSGCNTHTSLFVTNV